MIDWEYVQVAVDAPLTQPLTYKLPRELAERAEPGCHVKVPLGKRSSRGVLIGKGTPSEKFSIKNVIEITDEPYIGPKVFKWLRWLSQYYLHPPGQVFSMAAPQAGELRKRKAQNPLPTEFEKGTESTPPTLNADQQRALDEISGSLNEKRFQSFLLFGVTGSGKTEVYLRSIEKVLQLNRQALLLVPEINLTPQLIKRFVGRFGEQVAVFHSHLTERERADNWWQTYRGQKKILIGARSALFCPIENLGLIIVDEEHETSFKQEEQLKYNARDAAVMRAQFSECPIILGSATPSLESWQNVVSKKYKLLELPQRVENRPFPEMILVDMRLEKEKRREEASPLQPYWMSKVLYKELDLALKNKEQSALFLNRRGFAQVALCESCGFTESCPHCSVTLTSHGRGSMLLCHYCGYEKKLPPRCTSCKRDEYKTVGLGTEKIEEDLKSLFPEARVIRADRDEISNRQKLETLLSKINRGEVDIVVGTQMIAKGHDFPNLTLVGIVLADVGLHIPDFRSSERTFQLLTQVAGRAGRHERPGRVVLQTFVPENPSVQRALRHDYVGFASEELRLRDELQYPPFGKLAAIRFQGTKLDEVENSAEKAAKKIKALCYYNKEFEDIQVLGPCEAPLAKIKGKYRYHLLLKSASAKTLNLMLQHFLQNSSWVDSQIKVSIDVDPLQFM